MEVSPGWGACTWGYDSPPPSSWHCLEGFLVALTSKLREVELVFVRAFKRIQFGQQDGSSGKGACFRAWPPECPLQDPLGNGRKEPTLAGSWARLESPEASPARGALLLPVRLHLPKVLQPSKRVPQLSIKYSNI